MHALQILLSVSTGTGGSQKAEEYLRFSLKSESQKYNQESESDMAFACVAGPAECECSPLGGQKAEEGRLGPT